MKLFTSIAVKNLTACRWLQLSVRVCKDMTSSLVWAAEEDHYHCDCQQQDCPTESEQDDIGDLGLRLSVCFVLQLPQSAPQE